MALSGNQEMTELSRSFNKMMDENEQLNLRLVEANVRLYQAEIVRKQTDMAMLVSQINPHFLYNTLEVIKGMAYSVGSKPIADMTSALGTIFRYSLKAPEVVTLRKETEMLRNYLTIQLMRFGERFQVHYDLPEMLMDQDVPKMVLQPLCENAITHGLEMMEKGGHLYVSAYRRDDSLYIEVEDNGLGMEKETLDQVRAKLDKINDVASLYKMGTDGIGLVNVHGRLRMRYGDGYGLTIDSQAGKGTRVVLRMPGRRPQDCIRY
jgi:two-component system sensor histidine kinase YesM